MTNPSEAMQPCRECGADCSVQVFDSESVKATVWMCSRHPYLRGDCPSTTAYLSRTAWNEQAATPAAPVQNDDAEIERIALAMAQEIGWGTFSHFNPDDMRRLAKAAANARLTPDRVTPLVEALREAESEARRFAGFYDEGSDGRNTLVMLADKIAALREGTPDA